MCFPVFFLFMTHTLEKESKQALVATVKFEGSERTNNSTHTAHTHTYLYALTCCSCDGTPHTQPSPRDRIQRKEEGRKRE
ncbi:putative trans-sialidase [Trypanosoma cruzi Dm28c]|uniref:Putative trans-sialidase n=1 Tax=Trypanosoma cruzi Dm28c TaxID=1416333 RepID=V5AUV5_TRYCR|nr:putative trans-sialidase [Trypanosoma cruzi Dm28c]